MQKRNIIAYNKPIGSALAIVMLAYAYSSAHGAEHLEVAHAFPEIEIDYYGSAALAVSPDGRRGAYAVSRTSAVELQSKMDVREALKVGLQRSEIRLLETGERICVSGSGRQVWSPDGSRLAFMVVSGAEYNVWIYEASSGGCRRLANVKVAPGVSGKLKWSPNGHTLYVPAIRDIETTLLASGGSREPTSEAELPTFGKRGYLIGKADHSLAEIVAVDVESGEWRPIFPRSDELWASSTFHVSPSGRWVSFKSSPYLLPTGLMGYSLHIADTTSGTVSEIASELPFVNDLETSQYSWSPREDKLSFIQNSKIWEVNLNDEENIVRRLVSEDIRDVSNRLILYTSDGTRLIVGARAQDRNNEPGSVARGLAQIVLSTGEVFRTQFADDEDIIDILRFRDQSQNSAWHPKVGSIAVQVVNSSDGRQEVREIGPDGSITKVMGNGEGSYKYITPSRGSKDLIAIYEDLNTPENIYKLSPDLKIRERIADISDKYEFDKYVTAKKFKTTVPMHDGTSRDLNTSVILPPNSPVGSKVPAIVIFYPEYKNSKIARTYLGRGTAFSVPTSLLLEKGYAIILPDMELRSDNVPGDTLKNIADQVLPQVYKAVEVAGLDPHRLAIAGESFGAYGAIGVASRTDLFKVAMAINGIYDLVGGVDFGQYQERMGPGNYPWLDQRRFIDNSPYMHADKIKSSVLLIQGGEDYAIQDGVKLMRNLRLLKADVEMAVYDDRGHITGLWPLKDRLDIAARVVRFLDDRIGAHCSAGAMCKMPVSSPASKVGDK